jgi:hypothetical protein
MAVVTLSQLKSTPTIIVEAPRVRELDRHSGSIATWEGAKAGSRDIAP